MNGFSMQSDLQVEVMDDGWGICYAQCLVLLQWNSTISLELFLVLIAIMSGRLIFVSNIEY